MTVALWNKEYKKEKKKMEKSGIFIKYWKLWKHFCDALRNHGMFKHNIKAFAIPIVTASG